MNNGMGMNPMMNNGMGMNPMMNNGMGMSPMMNNGMGMSPMMGNGMGMNPMMGNGMGMNPMMGNGMGMGMNPMMGNGMGMGMNPMMMTPEQIKQWKEQQRIQGFLMGQMIARQRKQAQPKPAPQQSNTTNQSNSNASGELSIKFYRNGNTKTVRMESNKMIAELLNKYCETVHINSGNFVYKGQTLDPMDARSLSEIGMVNGDQINVS